MHTTRACGCWRRWGIRAWVSSMGENRFRYITCAMVLASKDSKRPKAGMPAPCTSTLHCHSAATWASGSRLVTRVRSVAYHSTRSRGTPPSRTRARACAARRAGERPASITLAPACTRRWAQAEPMPPLAPVSKTLQSLIFMPAPRWLWRPGAGAGCGTHRRTGGRTPWPHARWPPGPRGLAPGPSATRNGRCAPGPACRASAGS